jgi:hypothetical protein
LSATGTSTSTTRADDADEVLARVEWSIGESGSKPKSWINSRTSAGRGQNQATAGLAG